MLAAATNVHVESPDFKASILAAMSRIAEVNPTETLIDIISDADWKDSTVASWNVTAGSSIASADELD